jgi:hypothetical protein
LLVAERTIGVVDGRAGPTEDGPSASLVHLRCTAADALSNLVGILELASDGQVRCSAATRRPFAATVALVEDVLVAGDYYEGEPIASFAWPLLLQVGGLAQRAGTGLELTARGRAVLARPSYAALGALWDRWLTSVSHDELSRIEAIKGQCRTGTLTPPATRRAAVAAGLAAIRPGAWTQLGPLLSILRTRPPRLAVTRTLMARWRLYIADSYYGSLGHAGAQSWDIVEGRYALCVLLEYAATIGLIDVAYTDPCGARDDYRALWGAGRYDCLSRYDGLLAVRVNELGAAILHDPDALPTLGLPVPRRA